MMFDLESFMIGVLVGLILYGTLGGIAYGWVHRKIRENPYAPKKAY